MTLRFVIASLLCSLLWLGCHETEDLGFPIPPPTPTTGMPIGISINVAELPAAIQTYIATNFPTQSIAAIFYNEHPPHRYFRWSAPPPGGNHHHGHNGGGGNDDWHDHNGSAHDGGGGNNDDWHNHNDSTYHDYNGSSNETDTLSNHHGACHDDSGSGDSPALPTSGNNGGIYQVVLSDGMTLFFDENGNLVYIETPQGEWWENDHDHDELPIAISDLPDTIINHVAAYYPDHFIVKAEWQPNEQYEIRLNGGIKLYFDADGIALNLENEYGLRVSSISFPDTVQIGQTVLMTGYIVNESIYPFAGNTLRVGYDIEDEMPDSLLALLPYAQPFDSDLTIAPNDSIAFEFPIDIEAALFAPGFDIAIVWPDVPTSINPVFTNNPVMSKSVWVIP